ncbi:hypothetical protein ACMFMG_011292 [Clarireedia jacksonii]
MQLYALLLLSLTGAHLSFGSPVRNLVRSNDLNKRDDDCGAGVKIGVAKACIAKRKDPILGLSARTFELPTLLNPPGDLAERDLVPDEKNLINNFSNTLISILINSEDIIDPSGSNIDTSGS